MGSILDVLYHTLRLYIATQSANKLDRIAYPAPYHAAFISHQARPVEGFKVTIRLPQSPVRKVQYQ